MHLSHHTYVLNCVNELRSLCKENPALSQRLLDLQPAILSLASLDLEPARTRLQECYAPHHSGSQKPREPLSMLRCFLLMALLGITSFNKWARELKSRPELLILSGFGRLKPPGVGTFYDFINRILDGPYQKPCSHMPRPSSRFKGLRNNFRRQLQDEKRLRADEFDSPDEGKVKQSVARSLSRLEQALPQDFTKRINELLMLCAIIPSAERGLMGELRALAVAGDGSALPSQANGNGRPTCSCFQQGIRDCGCDRLYADPQATWGWDSYRKKYVFGFRLHAMSTKVAGRDLPLHIMIDGAHRPDVLMGVDATERLYKGLRQHLPKAKMNYGIFDAGYDATDFYKMWLQLKGTPIIALNQGNTPGADPDGIERNKHGTPLCPANIEFKRHGLNKKRGVVVYHCPAKYLGRSDGKTEFKVDLKRCPLGALCEPDSKMGPLVNLPIHENPRLNGPIERGSKAFKRLFNKRGTCERFFSRLEGKGLKSGCYRRKHIFLFQTMCAGIVIHAEAWVKKKFGETKVTDIGALFERLESLLE